MATRGKTWSDDKVQVMLSIWGDASVQRQLKGTVRNSHVFDKIVKELASKGYQCDKKQCREKLKQLKKKYKEVADSLRRSGAGVDSDDEFEESGIYVNFKFFSEIHSVMRGRPSVLHQLSWTPQRQVLGSPRRDPALLLRALQHLWSHLLLLITLKVRSL